MPGAASVSMAANAAAPRPDRLAVLDWLMEDEESARTWALFWRCCRRLAPVLRQSRTELTSFRPIALLRRRVRLILRRAIRIDLGLLLRGLSCAFNLRLRERGNRVIHRRGALRASQSGLS